MRITDSIASLLPSSYSSIGRALQSGGTRSPSVAASDVLELSGLARVASSLGAKGLEALRTLAGEANLDESRLADFVENLSRSGTSTGRTADILSLLGGFLDPLGSSGLETLFGEVEKRGVSGELNYLDAMDNLFDLGRRDVLSIFSAGEAMSDGEFETYLGSLATLLKNGVVGTLTVDYRGNPTEVFVTNEMGSKYARYPLYPERFIG